jgi:hypothetical protein
MREEDLVGFAG